MEAVETEGQSIDAAIEAALKMLGVPRDRADIEILANASRGLFGIGGRKARVRATVRRPVSTDLLDDDAEDGPPVSLTRTSAPQAVAIDSEVTERAGHVLQEITRRIGVDAGVHVRTENDHIILDLTGDSSGVLIGRRGQMLDALEYILNRIMARDEGRSARIVVDSQDYRTRRRLALEELARRMGSQAKKKQKPVTLNPMSPRDRRIVHLILQEDTSLTTRSSGRGYFRRLIIFPEGARKTARGDG
jgi:spoIIIJ-associated protein